MTGNEIIQRAIDAAMNGPMRWGQDDCCLWVADIVKERFGLDVAEPLRGYSSRMGAARALKQFAGGGLAEAALGCASECGLFRVTGRFRSFDIAVCANEAGPVLAVFFEGAWWARTDRGAVFMPPWAATLAWRVPSCHKQ